MDPASGVELPSITILVNVRDKFSPTARCLAELLQHTPTSIPIRALIGGASDSLRNQWVGQFGHRVSFDFHDGFLNQAQARNQMLAAVETELAVVMDNDVYVREGWLDALVRCQRETGASMVVPVILEDERRIHCAGTLLYVNYEGGRPFGHKELLHHGLPLSDGSNLSRRSIDYGELHLQLIVARTAVELGVYDERLLEVGEVDSGITWSASGCSLWFEPSSVVEYDLAHPVEWVDRDLFRWRWDMGAIAEGYRIFEAKWGLDITEQGGFKFFLARHNTQLPALSRRLRHRWSFEMHQWLRGIATSAKRQLKSRGRDRRVKRFDRRDRWADSSVSPTAASSSAPFARAWLPRDTVADLASLVTDATPRAGDRS